MSTIINQPPPLHQYGLLRVATLLATFHANFLDQRLYTPLDTLTLPLYNTLYSWSDHKNRYISKKSTPPPRGLVFLLLTECKACLKNATFGTFVVILYQVPYQHISDKNRNRNVFCIFLGQEIKWERPYSYSTRSVHYGFETSGSRHLSVPDQLV